jgi:hypothetical protein
MPYVSLLLSQGVLINYQANKESEVLDDFHNECNRK